MKTMVRMFAFTVLLAPICVVLAGCNLFGSNEKLRSASQALLTASEQCVYEVRDYGLKYEQGKRCMSLGTLVTDFTEAGGVRDDTPVEVKLEFAQTQHMAWMALALSESKRPGLIRIW